MPKMSWEGLVGTVLALIVVILDQAGIRNPYVLWGAFGVAVILCIDALARSRHPPKRKIIGIILTSVAVLAFAAYLIWQPHKEQIPDISVISSAPFVTDVKMSEVEGYASFRVDTKIMQPYAKCCYLLAILTVVDNSVDVLNDARIAKSERFTITGEVRIVQINLDKEFFDRAREARRKMESGNIALYLGVIPNAMLPSQIVSISDITRLGGKQLRAEASH
jgi:hypothetical protein